MYRTQNYRRGDGMTWYGLYETTYTQQIKHLSESNGHLPEKKSLWQRFVEWVKHITSE